MPNKNKDTFYKNPKKSPMQGFSGFFSELQDLWKKLELFSLPSRLFIALFNIIIARVL